jgi:hypothetical protein
VPPPYRALKTVNIASRHLSLLSGHPSRVILSCACACTRLQSLRPRP